MSIIYTLVNMPDSLQLNISQIYSTNQNLQCSDWELVIDFESLVYISSLSLATKLHSWLMRLFIKNTDQFKKWLFIFSGFLAQKRGLDAPSSVSKLSLVCFQDIAIILQLAWYDNMVDDFGPWPS